MNVEQMRDHFNRVAEHRLRQGEWTEADKAECNALIKAAIATGDAAEVKRWADWLAGIVADERLPPFCVAVRSCASCRHRVRPGLLLKGEPDFTYCGGGRADLPPAYGDGHPLRQFPQDGGTSCQSWEGSR